MLRGTVKFWNDDRGFGFIKRDDGQADAFVHVSQLRGTGIDYLTTGQPVEFELGRIPSNNRPCATNVRVLVG
jgi:CspA family cold shock protein